MIRQRFQPWAMFVLLLIAGLGAGGCAPLDLHKMRLPWQDKDEEFTPPERIVTFWSDTVLHQPGKPAVRGFGGRVFFYSKDDAEPIEVDGSLVVYAFDADHYDPSQQRPEKKYVFPADQVKQHFSDSNMGPSYSLWLPWDEVRGPTRNLSLVCRFEGREGGVVISEPVNKLLPGNTAAAAVNDESSRPEVAGAIQRTAYEQAVLPADATAEPSQTDDADGQLETAAINLPPGFIRRYQKDVAAADANTNAASTKTTPASASASDGSASSTSPAASAADGLPTASPPIPGDPGSPAAHSQSLRFPARRSVEALRGRGPLRTGPHPAGWPSALPATPRSGWARTSGASEPTYPTPSEQEAAYPGQEVPRN